MLIGGNEHTDARGRIRFVNDFDMSRVLRMYCIEPAIEQIRAWQGHRAETKWFYVAKGRFEVKSVRVADWEKPLKHLGSQTWLLSEAKSEVLEIQGGHLNGFRALEAGSVLMVFSDFSLAASQQDEVRIGLHELSWKNC